MSEQSGDLTKLDEDGNSRCELSKETSGGVGGDHG